MSRCCAYADTPQPAVAAEAHLLLRALCRMEYTPGLLSILIVNWKSKDYLRKCLHSVEATCADLQLQIVVVDGGSFDGCGDMLAAVFPYVEFVQSAENVGFGRSNNLGFQKVRGEYVLLLNPDTELRPNSVQAMLRTLSTTSDAALIGPRLLNTDGTLQKSSVQALPTPLNQALRSEFLMRHFPRSRLWGATKAYFETSPTSVEAVSGACMLLRSSDFHTIGGFHPAYFMYAEDMDLCYRIQYVLGRKVIHCPTSEVLHHGGGSSKTQFAHFSAKMKLEALATYFRLNHGASSEFLFRLFQGASAVVRLLYLYPSTLIRPNLESRISIERWTYVLSWATRSTSAR